MHKDKLPQQQEKFSFLLPENMKVLGFNCLQDGKDDGYYKYENDGTKHRNKDYNTEFPEGRGKVIVYVNINYSGEQFTNLPIVGIEQDGGTRSVYNGVVESEEFLETLLNSVR